MRRLAADRTFLDGRIGPATLDIEGDSIVGVHDGVDPAADRLEGLVAPGFVDVHGHGGGGAAFGTTDPAEVRRALDVHRRLGTTSQVASLVTESIASLEAQLDTLAPLVEAGELAGVHLEGPWLAEKYKGAHPASRLIDPVASDVDALLAAGRGTIRMVTIAPERPGGLDAVSRLVAAGVVVAVGHSDADHATTRAALARGASGATHLFNAMAPLHHRRPGPILAFWESNAYLELIADGVHVDPDLVTQVMRAAPERVVLITDAMAAACAHDGDYTLGELDVVVTDGVARLAEGGAIAGSTLTLDAALRNVVGAGVPLEQALTALTRRPAEYLRLARVGRLAEGCYADVVVLDDDLRVSSVLRRGRWLA